VVLSRCCLCILSSLGELYGTITIMTLESVPGNCRTASSCAQGCEAIVQFISFLVFVPPVYETYAALCQIISEPPQCATWPRSAGFCEGVRGPHSRHMLYSRCGQHPAPFIMQVHYNQPLARPLALRSPPPILSYLQATSFDPQSTGCSVYLPCVS